MLWRAYAILTHAMGRAGLRPQRRRNSQRPVSTTFEALRRIEDIDRSVWLAGALGAAAESGLARALETETTIAAAAAAADMPAEMAEAILDVLGAAGLTSRRGELWSLAPGVRAVLERNGSGWLQAAARASWLQAADIRERARSSALDLDGWRHTDREVIEAQGLLTFGMVQEAVPKLASLPGLLPSLERPGAALLDVGAGAAGLSIALCIRFPQLRAVALEPAEVPAGIGREKVREAGLASRIEIRRERAEDFALENEFDLAFLPQMFLDCTAIEAALANMHRAVKPGGWLLVASVSRPGGDLPAAVGRLQNLLWGGNRRSDAAVAALLERAGFDPVILPPGGRSIRTLCARRPKP